MDHAEAKKLHDQLDSLISAANTWTRIHEFFTEDPQIAERFEEVRKECVRDGCYSSATMVIETVRKLLEEVSE